MSIVTHEGIVERGQSRKTNARLPEGKKVYVIVPDVQVQATVRVASPRLAHPEQAADFKMEIVKEHQGR